jgi:hypothetical protein
MKVIRWAGGIGRFWGARNLVEALPKPVAKDDPRATRYLAQAEGYNKAAEAMGYGSFQEAVAAGKMREIVRQVTARVSSEGKPG